MPAQRINFVRTLGLIILLLLGLGAAGPAMALQFDTFSLTAHIEPRSAANFGFGSAGVIVTAYPDFRLSAGTTLVNSGVPSESSFFFCVGALECRPGDRVIAEGHRSGVDANGTLSFSGQFYGPCDPAGRPLGAFLLPPGPARCISAAVDLTWAPAFLPPFTGATETTVATTFSAFVSAKIVESGVPGDSVPRVVDGVFFSGTVVGQYDLLWQKDTQTWLPLGADAHIAATPEPATLLLFGTTAAGLGLARWYRRRTQGHQDAA